MRELMLQRREFLMAGAATVIGASAVSQIAVAQDAPAPAPGRLKKSVLLSMLPLDIADAEKFAMAKRVGFEGIEAAPNEDLKYAAELGALAKEAGVPIHSVIYGGWKDTLSDPDPAVVDRGVAGVEQALRCAKAYGADAVLVVPAVVNENVRYVDAYERSQRAIRKLIPLAKELGVIIAVENVWNKFLLSPIEFAKYVDEFESEWVRAYFDCGNVVIFGYPEDWIRTAYS